MPSPERMPIAPAMYGCCAVLPGSEFLRVRIFTPRQFDCLIIIRRGVRQSAFVDDEFARPVAGDAGRIRGPIRGRRQALLCAGIEILLYQRPVSPWQTAIAVLLCILIYRSRGNLAALLRPSK